MTRVTGVTVMKGIPRMTGMTRIRVTGMTRGTELIRMTGKNGMIETTGITTMTTETGMTRTTNGLTGISLCVAAPSPDKEVLEARLAWLG